MFLLLVYKAVEGYAGHNDGSIFIDKAIMAGARELAANRGGTAVSTAASHEIVLSSRDSENAQVLAAISELLRMIDDALAVGKLSFSAAFRVACDAIAAEFPFMRESRGALVYENGEIALNADADAEVVSSAVFSALRPIFRRLRSEQKYSELFKILSDSLLELATERGHEFVRLGLMDHIEDLLAAD